LPEVSTNLPARMAARRIPAAICDWLNLESKSPFHRLIRRASMRGEEANNAVIWDTSIVKMLEESITSPSGSRYPYRNVTTGETDFDAICELLVTYWSA